MPPSAVVIDTDVFSSLFLAPGKATRTGKPVARWRTSLAGTRVVICFQTRAEVMAGMLISGWGAHRVAEAQEKLDATPTIGADEEVIAAFAELTARCRNTGHALHDKIHTADRWIAACAIAKKMPLLSGDRVYRGAPGLTLL